MILYKYIRRAKYVASSYVELRNVLGLCSIGGWVRVSLRMRKATTIYRFHSIYKDHQMVNDLEDL
jgi:hypothetical protein